MLMNPLPLRLAQFVLILLITTTAAAQEAKRKGKGRRELPPDDGRPPQATKIDQIKALKDFRVELLYSVPRAQGSWVSMCLDPQGRLIVSDQANAGMFRVTPPPVGRGAAPSSVAQGTAPSEPLIEPIKLEYTWPDGATTPFSGAQGLLWAFNSLYVVINSRGGSGLYRCTDTNNDGELDKVVLLRALQGGGGEHGPHAVLLAPDGKSLFVVCGNQTRLTEFSASRVPPIWGEDHLLPRMPDGNGFMRGVLGPGGAIYQVDPEGKDWVVNTVGFRNEYDAAFNRHGDLFATDQEGATWLPNGNPFDELLDIRHGRHYGFPPRHPKHLPRVFDEPSLFDYGPQHQSTCGMIFNLPLATGGPSAELMPTPNR